MRYFLVSAVYNRDKHSNYSGVRAITSLIESEIFPSQKELVEEMAYKFISLEFAGITGITEITEQDAKKWEE